MCQMCQISVIIWNIGQHSAQEQAIAKKAAAVARREELQREAEAAAVAETRRLQAGILREQV